MCTKPLPSFIQSHCGDMPGQSEYDENSLFNILRKVHTYTRPISVLWDGLFYSSLFIILCMSIEQFILNSLPALAQMLDIRQNRIWFYVFVIVSAVLIPLTKITDYIHVFYLQVIVFYDRIRVFSPGRSKI